MVKLSPNELLDLLKKLQIELEKDGYICELKEADLIIVVDIDISSDFAKRIALIGKAKSISKELNIVELLPGSSELIISTQQNIDNYIEKQTTSKTKKVEKTKTKAKSKEIDVPVVKEEIEISFKTDEIAKGLAIMEHGIQVMRKLFNNLPYFFVNLKEDTKDLDPKYNFKEIFLSNIHDFNTKSVYEYLEAATNNIHDWDYLLDLAHQKGEIAPILKDNPSTLKGVIIPENFIGARNIILFNESDLTFDKDRVTTTKAIPQSTRIYINRNYPLFQRKGAEEIRNIFNDLIESSINKKTKNIDDLELDKLGVRMKKVIQYDFPLVYYNDPEDSLVKRLSSLIEYIENSYDTLCPNCGYKIRTEGMKDLIIISRYNVISQIYSIENINFMTTDDDPTRMDDLFYDTALLTDTKLDQLAKIFEEFKKLRGKDNKDEFLKRYKIADADLPLFRESVLRPHKKNPIVKDLLIDPKNKNIFAFDKAQKSLRKLLKCVNPSCNKSIFKIALYNIRTYLKDMVQSSMAGRPFILYGNPGDGKSAMVDQFLRFIYIEYGVGYSILNVDESTNSYLLKGGYSPYALSGNTAISGIKYGFFTRAFLPPNFMDDADNIVPNTAENRCFDEQNRAKFEEFAFMMGFFEAPYQIMLDEDNGRVFRNPNKNPENRICQITTGTMNLSDIGNEPISFAFKSRYDMYAIKYIMSQMKDVVRRSMNGMSHAELKMFELIYNNTLEWQMQDSIVYIPGIRHYQTFFKALRMTVHNTIEGYYDDILYISDENELTLNFDETMAKKGLDSKVKLKLLDDMLENLIHSSILMPLIEENDASNVNKMKEQSVQAFKSAFYNLLIQDIKAGKYPYLNYV